MHFATTSPSSSLKAPQRHKINPRIVSSYNFNVRLIKFKITDTKILKEYKPENILGTRATDLIQVILKTNIDFKWKLEKNKNYLYWSNTFSLDAMSYHFKCHLLLEHDWLENKSHW